MLTGFHTRTLFPFTFLRRKHQLNGHYIPNDIMMVDELLFMEWLILERKQPFLWIYWTLEFQNPARHSDIERCLLLMFWWCLNTTGSQNPGYSESCASLKLWTIHACGPYGRNVNSSRNETTTTPELCAALNQETIPIEVLAHIGFLSCRSVFISPNASFTRNLCAGVCVTQCERSEHHTNDSA